MKLSEHLRTLLEPILQREEARLVELQVTGRQNNKTIKVFVDKQDGISLKQCEAISRSFADELELEEGMPGSYRIEVSSPGLDRPLLEVDDFARNLNREIRLTYLGEETHETFQGRIVGVSEETVLLQGKQERKSFPIARIKHGKIMLPW